MLLANYSFLGLGAAISCFFAFGWLKTEVRRNVVLSFIAGIICGLSVFLGLSMRTGGEISFVFLIVYTFVMLWREGTVIDRIAGISLVCGCFGMFQVTVRTILCMGLISDFFSEMLVIICILGFLFLYQWLSGEFPDEGWQEHFGKESVVWFMGLGLCLSLPAMTDICSVPVMFLEWFGFFGGLKLCNLMIISHREKEMIHTEKQYRDDMQTYMSVIRSQRHDYNFHVQTLHGLLLRKDYQACESYLNELLHDSIAMNQLLPLQDAAVSALILSFKNKAAQNGIHMDIMIENDLSQIVTSVYETNKVIGNLLQNAIDETEILADKTYGIKLSILKRGEFCIISVSNRTGQNNPMENYQIGHSSKAGHEGIGIASIQALAAKYGGVVYSRMEKDIVCFVAKLPLRLY